MLPPANINVTTSPYKAEPLSVESIIVEQIEPPDNPKIKKKIKKEINDKIEQIDETQIDETQINKRKKKTYNKKKTVIDMIN